MQTVDFELILRTLLDYEVDFIVVGGVSAVLHGAPLYTVDPDVVQSSQRKAPPRSLRES